MRANTIIPLACPMNLPGHNLPSKYSATKAVPIIKVYDINVPPRKEINIGFRLNQGQTNCPLV